MPAADRGSVWIVDLGMAAKVRPCVIMSVPTDPQDRVLVTVVMDPLMGAASFRKIVHSTLRVLAPKMSPRHSS